MITKMEPQRMNLLLIMTDQHRADWLGCVGVHDVSTPSIDRIAKRGVRFTQASCCSPLCAPSRASLAAGVYPHRLGILGNKHNFPQETATYYQALRKAGYRVAVVGKTDLHKGHHHYGANGDLPVMYQLGFTDPHETEGKRNAGRPMPGSGGTNGTISTSSTNNTNGMNGMNSTDSMSGTNGTNDTNDMNDTNDTNGTNKDYVTAGPYQAYLQERGLLDDFVQDMKQREQEQPVWHTAGTPLPAEHFHDSYIGQKACDYLRKVTDESPWHLFVSFVGPHDPWDAPAEYAKKYADTTFTAAIPPAGEGKPEWVRRKANIQSAGMSPDDLAQVKQHYSGAVELIDEWIGRILDIVEQRGLLEQTAIVFCADHGEMLGDHGLFQKSVMYEAALRVPLIVSVPGMSQPMGKTSNALVELIDIHPTLLDLAGVEYLREPLDAKSLMPLIKDATEQHKRYQISILDHCRMIADGEYKLIENANEGNELYRLEEDPSEQVNRLHDEPEIARRLLAQLKKACI